ncbi:unnamed protein product [Parnassius apollo]|uniref:(apollo) hypothetical protein n=1 Tax=Parnassius apollo TaxID=110799 RepID=A0A8S3XVJ1_PARAO|nr:unnamed protein product [Parnassius apollo]
MGTVTTGFLLLLSASLIAGYCPREEHHHLGFCAYRIKCFNTIKGATLGQECQGASNNDIMVDLTLQDAYDGFLVNVTDTEFLTSITSLKVLGNWPQTNLSFLEYTVRLTNLNLGNMQIKQIYGRPFQYLSRLEILDLSHNQLSEIDELFTFEYSNKIKKLYLAYNKISEIPGYVFQELTSLIELDLSNNLIEDLNEEPFSNLTNLETLNLNNNCIKYLNGAINKKLLNLKHLFINNNKINNIDDKSLDKIYHLETFEFSNNKLNKLMPKLLYRHWDHFGGHLKCRIILSGNQLSVIKNATSKELKERIDKHRIDGLRTELDLSKNEIERIEYNGFQYVANIMNLDVSHNRLRSFVVNITDLANIRFFNLSNNFITGLDFTTFSHMNNLQNLDLSNNRFDYVPDQSLSYTHNLKQLNITYNGITQVEGFHVTFHTSGGILDLSNNTLSSFNVSPGQANGLIELILHSNNISDASQIQLKHLRNLTKLDLSKNIIGGLNESSLQLPVTLIFLDLSSNRIKNISPSTFYRVTHLRTLRLAHNYLKNIEYGTFRGLTSLLNLDISFNMITNLNSKALLDLKFLRFLSIRHNDMVSLECNAWISHKNDLIVFLDGNKFSCEWLETVLTDYNNGYSKMHPAVNYPQIAGSSLEGIPCVKGPDNLIRPRYVMVDERLLAINQKILEAVKEQTSYLRKYIWRYFLHEANRTDGMQSYK